MNEAQRKQILALIRDMGGFNECLKIFGWKGGTIHQVEKELLKRLNHKGYILGSDGVIYENKLEISQKPLMAHVHEGGEK